MKLSYCTLTGVDDSTSLEEIESLSAKFPFAEWGFLYSPSASQRGISIYPGASWISAALKELPPSVHVALHVCGNGISDLFSGEEFVVQDLVDSVKSRAGRVQLNFTLGKRGATLPAIAAFLDKSPSLRIITQHNAANADVVRLMDRHPNHAVLFDDSGGKGKLGTWERPLDGYQCGYAGGLDQHNLKAELTRIAAVAGAEPFWIDMQAGLRLKDDSGIDKFELNKAEACLHIVHDLLHE